MALLSDNRPATETRRASAAIPAHLCAMLRDVSVQTDLFDRSRWGMLLAVAESDEASHAAARSACFHLRGLIL